LRLCRRARPRQRAQNKPGGTGVEAHFVLHLNAGLKGHLKGPLFHGGGYSNCGPRSDLSGMFPVRTKELPPTPLQLGVERPKNTFDPRIY